MINSYHTQGVTGLDEMRLQAQRRLVATGEETIIHHHGYGQVCESGGGRHAADNRHELITAPPATS